MPNVAANIRGQVQADSPGATVASRGPSHITHDLGNGQSRYIGITGPGMHRADASEIDTAWVAGTAPWDWQIANADHVAEVHTDFDVAENVRMTAPTGESITLQALPLSWSDDLDAIQQIEIPQNVNGAPGVDDEDGRFFWPGAYGPDLDFEWINHPQKLDKNLIINNLAALPAYTLGNPNPVLQLQIRFGISAGVQLWIKGFGDPDYVQFSLGGGNREKDTVESVQFRNGAGDVLWVFQEPMARDSTTTSRADAEHLSLFRIKKQGPNLNVFVRVEKSWLDSAVYPVRVDTTLNLTNTSTQNEAHEKADDSGASSGGSIGELFCSSNTSDASRYFAAVRFSGVTIPNADTIDTCVFTASLFSTSNDDANFDMHFEDIDDSPVYSAGGLDVVNRVRTTASTAWVADGVGSGSKAFPDTTSALQEVVDRGGWASGQAVSFLVISRADANKSFKFDAQAFTDEKLDITYTAGGGGGPVIPVFMAQYRQRWN